MDSKTTGMIIGVLIVLGLIAFATTVSAHFENSNTADESSETSAQDSAIEDTHDAMHESMHEAMHSDYGGMGCMGLALDEMDSDNDGLCDYCGMNVEMCEQMEDMHNSMNSEMNSEMHDEMHEAMHKSMHGDSGFSCH